VAAKETTVRKILFLLLFVPAVLPAQSAQDAARPSNSGASGRWIVNTDFFGSTIYFRMELKQEGEKLTGNFDGDKLEGTLKGNTIYFLAKDDEGGTDEVKAQCKARPSPGRSCSPTRTTPSDDAQVYGGARSLAQCTSTAAA